MDKTDDEPYVFYKYLVYLELGEEIYLPEKYSKFLQIVENEEYYRLEEILDEMDISEYFIIYSSYLFSKGEIDKAINVLKIGISKVLDKEELSKFYELSSSISIDQLIVFEMKDGELIQKEYNITELSEDCIVLPKDKELAKKILENSRFKYKDLILKYYE